MVVSEFNPQKVSLVGGSRSEGPIRHLPNPGPGFGREVAKLTSDAAVLGAVCAVRGEDGDKAESDFLEFPSDPENMVITQMG